LEDGGSENQLASAIQDFLERRSDGTALLRLFRAQVERRTRSYPNVYFGGERDSDAIADIANEVFVACLSPVSWSPFDGRTPFDLFVEEQHPDGSILWLLFQGNFSLLRDVMRRQPARWGGPEDQHRRQVNRVLNGILARTCVRQEAAEETWAAPLCSGPAPADREALVPWLVGRFGPLSRRDILRLTLAWEGRGESEEHVHESSPLLDVRSAIVDTWWRLDPWDRALVVSIARGDPYVDILGWFPSRDSVALSRRLSAVNRRFLEALGLPEAAVPPKELAERVAAVLIELPRVLSGVPPEAWRSSSRGPDLDVLPHFQAEKEGERSTKGPPFGVPRRLQRLSDADAAAHCLQILRRALERGFLGAIHTPRPQAASFDLDEVPPEPPPRPQGALGDLERFVLSQERWLYAVAMPSGVSVLVDARRPIRLWGAVLPFGAWTHVEGRNLDDVRASVAELRG
jgi:hypothetical protein